MSEWYQSSIKNLVYKGKIVVLIDYIDPIHFIRVCMRVFLANILRSIVDLCEFSSLGEITYIAYIYIEIY